MHGGQISALRGDIRATLEEALNGPAHNSKQQTHFPKSSLCSCVQSSHPSIPHPKPAEKPASSIWNPTEQGPEPFTACYCCFLSQSPFCKDFIGLSSQWQPVGTRTKAAVTVEGNGHTADSLGMTSWGVILEHPENSLLLPRSWSRSSPTDSGWLRKFHGSSICCRWGSLFSYWWVSRSAGLCGFQQAPQRLPDGPSQDGAYCSCVSMGALQMEPPGVIRQLRRGVWGGGGRWQGIGATGGGGQSYLWGRSVTLDSHGMIFSPIFVFFFFWLFWLRFDKGECLCFICLQTREQERKSPESYLLKLQGRKYLGHNVSPCMSLVHKVLLLLFLLSSWVKFRTHSR